MSPQTALARSPALSAPSETGVHDPLLSVVIVNSDGTQDTLNCLESLFRFPIDGSMEVILVDNCSRVPCLEIVSRLYPQVRTYSAPERQGFSKNYNLGIRKSRGAYILILNNDTVVHQGALQALVDALENNAANGMAGPRLVSSAGSIQPECARGLPSPRSYMLRQLFLDPMLPSGRVYERYLRRKLSKQPGGPVPAINGACMLVTRQTVQTVGLLDEGFDFYYEDIEWCHRLQRRGKQIAYVAESLVTHLGDQSLSRVKVRAKQSEYRSAIRYFRQYHQLSRGQEWVVWIVTLLSFWLRARAFSVIERLSGKESHAEAYLTLCEWIRKQRPSCGNDRDDGV